MLCFCYLVAAAEWPAVQTFFDPAFPITPYDIAEDRDGYLWLACEQAGVFRFDGAHYRKIPGDFVRPVAIAVTPDGSVWVGSQTGLYQYDGGGWRLVDGAEVYSLAVTADGMLVVKGSNAGPRPLEIGMSSPKGWQFHLQKQGANQLIVDGNEGVWTYCWSQICRISSGKEAQKLALTGDLPVIEGRVPSPPVRRQGNVYVTRGAESVFWVRQREWVWAIANGRVLPRQFVGTDLIENWGMGLRTDHAGRTWVPGYDLWVTEGTELRRFQRRELVGKVVETVYPDRQGRIWFGVRGSGLALMNGDLQVEGWPVAEGEVTSIARDSAGTHYAATESGRVMKLSPGDNLWHEFGKPLEPLGVRYLAGEKGGTLLALSADSGLLRINAMGAVLDRIELPQLFRAADLRRLLVQPDGTAWIAGMHGTYRMQGKRVDRLLAGLDDSGRPNALGISIDHSDGVWIGGIGGVCRVGPEDCPMAATVADGLLSDNVLDVAAPGPAGDLWTVYRNTGDFSRLVRTAGGWTSRHFRAGKDFGEGVSKLIKRDSRGWIWRGSEEGLWVSDGVHLEPEDWIAIHERHGLPSASVSRWSFLEDPDGTIWVGTTRGIAHISPNEKWFRRDGPVRISDAPAEVAAGAAWDVHFAGRGLLPVRYRLWPLETDWRLTRTAAARYSNVPAGEYTIQTLNGTWRSEQPVRVLGAPGVSGGWVYLGVAGAMGVAVLAARRRRRGAAVLPDLQAWREAALRGEGRMPDRYQTVRTVSRGGFGTVYEVLDTEAGGARRALKLFHPDFAHQEWLDKRFAQEVRALETLNHPNIVRIFGHGETGEGVPYLVMDFVEGPSLREVILDGPLAPPRLARIVRQLGDALATVHGAGIFHRDIKPENVLLRDAGTDCESAVLIDFSIAIIQDPGETTHRLSRAAGTLAYIAPEQAIGVASAASDVYGLAMVTIELLFGQRVVALLPEGALDYSGALGELLRAHVEGLDEAAANLLISALEFHPRNRPAGVREFAAAVAAGLERVTCVASVPPANGSLSPSDSELA